MVQIQAILAAFLSFLPHPNPDWNETQSAYEARVTVIAQAIHLETTDVALAAAVATIVLKESSLDPRVHAGEKRGDSGRSICLGQNKAYGMTEQQWLELGGTDLDATRRCIALTARRLRGSLGMCRRQAGRTGKPVTGNDMLRAFTQYGDGFRCDPDITARPADFRARLPMWVKLRNRIWLHSSK